MIGLISWKPHYDIQQVCSKISSGSWALLILRNYAGINILNAVYYSLIYSHLQ